MPSQEKLERNQEMYRLSFLKDGKMSIYQLSRKYGVVDTVVRRIIHREHAKELLRKKSGGGV